METPFRTKVFVTAGSRSVRSVEQGRLRAFVLGPQRDGAGQFGAMAGGAPILEDLLAFCDGRWIVGGEGVGAKHK